MLHTMGTTPLKACHGPEGGGAEETHVVLVANNKVPAQRKRERKTNLDLKKRISILRLVKKHKVSFTYKDSFMGTIQKYVYAVCV